MDGSNLVPFPLFSLRLYVRFATLSNIIRPHPRSFFISQVYVRGFGWPSSLFLSRRGNLWIRKCSKKNNRDNTLQHTVLQFYCLRIRSPSKLLMSFFFLGTKFYCSRSRVPTTCTQCITHVMEHQDEWSAFVETAFFPKNLILWC